MKYKCLNEECGKQFIHTSELKTYDVFKLKLFNIHSELKVHDTFDDDIGKIEIKLQCCPYCNSLSYDEIHEETEKVKSVYIYELSTGKQEKLDELLADGYVIVNRYAKQYHLEKKV